jgi:glycosyltransferase involved in cell wall biosynthesis
MVRERRKHYDVAFFVPWLTALLTNENVRPTGGAETQIYLVSRALAARGLRVCLIVYELPGVKIPSNVDGVDVIVRPPNRGQKALIGKVWEAAAISRSLAGLRVDTVVTRTAGPHAGIVALTSKLRRRQFVYSSANIVDFDSGRVLAKRRDRALFRLATLLADEIVVQSEEQVELCRGSWGRTPVLIRSIAEPAQLRTARPKAFLWIGRLVWYKQPLAYIELARALPDARFWMVGVPPPERETGRGVWEQVTQAAGAVSNLELLQPRPRSELLDLIERAVAIVDTADFEGMPNIFLEGWSRGVPALSLTHDPNGVIDRFSLGGFAGGSTPRLEAVARELWQGREDQHELAERCRRYIAGHHSREVVAAQWQEALGLAIPVRRHDAVLQGVH